MSKTQAEINEYNFCNLLLQTERFGVSDLIEWLKGTDFFTAPASTKYHSNYEGGLVQHSLNVRERLILKAGLAPDLSLESATICGLLHDVCKAGVYKKTLKNVQKYHDKGKREDAGGKFDWAKEEGYAFEDTFPMGHGAKSLFMVSRFIDLTETEAAMILHHMGGFAGGDAARDFTNAAGKWPCVALIHAADLEASFCMERRPDSETANDINQGHEPRRVAGTSP